MAKKRNCRRDPKERDEHERAVTLRKMTDKQLLEYCDGRYQAGFDAGRLSVETSMASIKGIGAATLAKLREAMG